MTSVSLPDKENSLSKFLPVVLLVPNIIGYVRILLLLIGVVTAFSAPLFTFFCFFISGNLDALDGYCARLLKQESKMGSVLDYATDRATDIAIFVILIQIYSFAWTFFCILLMLDIFSHICQVYATIFSKSQNHKEVTGEQNIFLQLYYSKRMVLCFACASYALWLGLIYLYHFYSLHWIFVLSLICIPGFIYKVGVHIFQILNVFRIVASHDSEKYAP